jgi:hypothetical protein
MNTAEWPANLLARAYGLLLCWFWLLGPAFGQGVHPPSWVGTTRVDYGLPSTYITRVEPGSYGHMRSGNQVDYALSANGARQAISYDLTFSQSPFNNTVDNNIGAARLFLADGAGIDMGDFARALFSNRNADWSTAGRVVIDTPSTRSMHGLFRYFTFNADNLRDATSLHKNYIILIHGWNPDNNDNPYATGNFAILKSNIDNWLSASGMNHWRVLTYMMPSDTATGDMSVTDLWKYRSGSRAAEVARLHGYHMARSLIDKVPDVRRVHLIAHSAGSWTARSCAEYLLDHASQLQAKGLQVTLLDAYVPAAVDADWLGGLTQGNTYLSVPLMNAMLSFNNTSRVHGYDNYYATGGWWWNNPPGTKNSFSWSSLALPVNNVDTKEYSPSRWHDHSGPIRYYADSVASPLAFGGVGGWRQSIAYTNLVNPPPPDPPAEINYPTASSSGSFSISWSASWSATSYRLELSSNQGSSWSHVWTGSGTSYADTRPNGGYRYRVRAINAAGSGDWKTGGHDCWVTISGGGGNDGTLITMPINATRDTYVWSADPNANYGNSVQSQFSFSSSSRNRAYLYFPLDIPAGTTIESAKIDLFVTVFAGSGFTWPTRVINVDAHRVTGSWTETGITWNNQPSFAYVNSEPWYQSQNFPDKYMSIGARHLVNQWLAHGNNGVMLRLDESYAADCSVAFSTKEYLSGQRSPKLIIEVYEKINEPTTLSGPSTGITGQSLEFTAGGASSSLGHSLQYRFDWGDGGSVSSWGSATRSKTYSSAGSHPIRVQARCSSHTTANSEWSAVLKTVEISQAHTVNTPNTPSGPSSGYVGVSYEYSTAGSSCAHGHPVEHQFDWGDSQSSWGGPSVLKSFSTPNAYSVRARARCAVNTAIQSSWSGGKSVTISTIPTFTLHVGSLGADGVVIESSSGHGGTTAYSRSITLGTSVALVAPQYHGAGAHRTRFAQWTGDINSQNREILFDMNSTKSLTANYTDDPLTLVIDPTFRTHSSLAATGQEIDVIASGYWTAVANAGWITLEGAWHSSGGGAPYVDGSGDGLVRYSVSANTGGQRSSTITFTSGDLVSIFTVTQNAAPDTQPPTVTITSPTSATTWTSPTNRMYIGGTASDNVGVSSVRVHNFRDIGDYLCTGTTSWQYNGLPLFQGANLITVTARDAAGNTGTDTLNVTFNNDAQYDDVLRSGAVMQEIQFPDNLTPGSTVTVRWKVLSYVPVISRVYGGVPGGWVFFKNGTYTGFEQSPWNLSGRHAGVYSFECAFPVPQKSGDFNVWFNVAQMDSHQFMIPVIPDGVDARPDPTYAKLIRRTILAGGNNADPQSDPDTYASSTKFENVDHARKRSAATVVAVTLPDNLTPGTQVTAEWKVHSYVSINGQLLMLNLNQQQVLLEANATRIGNAVQTTFNFQDRTTGTRYYASEYTFRATFTVPNQPGTHQIFFRCQESGVGGSQWMGATLAAGIDGRPAEYNGMFGRFIERTINP